MSGKDSHEKDSKRLEMLEAEIAKADEEIRRRQEAVSEKRAEARRIRARLKYAERRNQSVELQSMCDSQQAEIERLRAEITALKNSPSVQIHSNEEGRTSAEIMADDTLTATQKLMKVAEQAHAEARRSENALIPDTRDPYVQESTDAVGQLF